jgi:hypothetical protein
LLPRLPHPRWIARSVFFFFLSVVFCCANAAAQATPTAANTGSVTANGTGPAGIIPADHGASASLITATQHDSVIGWSSILTPGVAYRFNPAFSVNGSVPIYTYINVVQNVGTRTKPVYVTQTKHGVLGDSALSAVFELHPDFLTYSATFGVGLPSGKTTYGLESGHVGYNFNNHFEKDFGFVTPNIEVGVTNSSSLLANRARKHYTSSGTLAHFQVGASIDLSHNVSFEADGYEDMPLSTATIYSAAGRGKKTSTMAPSASAAEDNGLNTSLDVPLNGHITVSAFYDHSIRSQYDVVGFLLTFLLKAPPHHNATF